MNTNAKGSNAVKQAKDAKEINDSIVIDYAEEVSKTFFNLKKLISPDSVRQIASEDEIKKVIDEQVSLSKEVEEYYIQNPDGVRNMSIEFLYAYKKIKEMWESDGAKHNFVKHLFISFGNPDMDVVFFPEGTKADVDRPFCCILNTIAISKKEIERVNNQFFAAHKKWTEENPGKPMPSKIYKLAWVVSNAEISAVYSKKSDKTLSYCAFRAVTKLFHELGTDARNKEIMGIVRHFVEEERHEHFLAAFNDETREEYVKTREAEKKHYVSHPKAHSKESLSNVAGADKLAELRKQLEQEQK